MNTIELRGTISNIRYSLSNEPLCFFRLNGQFCTYHGTIPLKIGDYVEITGRLNESTYTNAQGIIKTFREVVVTSIIRR